MIPPVVLNAANERLAQLDRLIAAYRDEARELTAWLERAEGRTQEQLPMPTVTKPTTAPRTTRAPMAKVGNNPRPQRIRAGTETTEHYFPRGSYSSIAFRLGFGSHDATGVWLTVDEWTRAKGENYRSKKAR